MLPGIPLITLVDLHDMWVQFDLREDLLRDLKVGYETRRAGSGPAAIGSMALEVRVIGVEGRIHRLACHAGDRRLRPAHLRDPRLSRAAGRRPAAGHERLYRLADLQPRSMTPHNSGLLAVAARKCAGSCAITVAWLPAVWRAGDRLRVARAYVQLRRRARPRCRRRRYGPLGDVAAVHPDPCGRAGHLGRGARRRPWRGGIARSAPGVPSPRSTCRRSSARMCWPVARRVRSSFINTQFFTPGSNAAKASATLMTAASTPRWRPRRRRPATRRRRRRDWCPRNTCWPIRR